MHNWEYLQWYEETANSFTKDHDRREIELYCKSKHTQAQGRNNIDIDGTITEFARLNFDGVSVLPFFAVKQFVPYR